MCAFLIDEWLSGDFCRILLKKKKLIFVWFFRFYFKKDSLWFSEDLSTVPNHDANRVCILQVKKRKQKQKINGSKRCFCFGGREEIFVCLLCIFVC